MTSLMLNTLNVSNDPFSISLPSPIQMSTFFESFDAFSASQYPWTIQPPFNMSYQSPLSQAVLPTFGQVNGLSYQLNSPTQSPNSFFFEIEPDKTTYENCYDEFMEIKLAVLQEILSRGKLMTATPTLDSDSARSSPALSPPPSGVSTPSSSSNDSSFGCRTPDFESSPMVDIVVDGFADSDLEDDKDGDYMPFAIKNSSSPVRRRLFDTVTPHKSLEPKKYAEPKLKRKATHTTELSASKRQKTDIDVICRIRGCRHISKTKFECFKHRETHFPGRFQCPQPNCQKIFIRSSSLSRHLKRERNNACGIFAGPQAGWGVGLVNFELTPPPWLAVGYLDDVSHT